MSVAQGDLLGLGQSDQRPSSSSNAAGLTLNLSSNNPFRNRAASPNNFSPPPPHSPFDDPPARPVSRNPFLDPFNQPPAQSATSPDKMATSRNTTSLSAEELFENLIIDDGTGKKPLSKPNGDRPSTNRPPGGARRPENAPSRGRGPPPNSHRPTRSQEEALRARKPEAKPKELNIFESPPQKRSEPRPRRNSDTSVLEIEKPMTEEEKKRRKERERRHRDQKSKPSRKLDVIDKLDATGIYGGGLFHHDGPFDACNPHRNRKGSRRAPMHAFAKDSANNSLGGAGPLNARPDHAAIMGYHDDEAFKDYAAGAKEPIARSGKEAALFDPKGRESVHGDESLGLGTSTFLEGTPVAQTVLQRRLVETAQESMDNGLQRKKSLAQRIRHINRGPSTSGRITSPDAVRTPRSGELPSANSRGERNPFFNEFGTEDEEITVKDPRSRSPVSPDEFPPTLERRATADAPTALDSAGRPQGGGFMHRVKSLKGGRRPRPDQSHGPPPGPPSAGGAI